MTEIKDVFTNLSGMNYYWHSEHEHPNTVKNENLYVEFKTESDLINATSKTMYYKTFKITSAKKGIQSYTQHTCFTYFNLTTFTQQNLTKHKTTETYT